ncbi:MAG TPA: hypothetical protein VFN42_00875 [Acetobacteraceae bacterium]|nr:hypothetical protein [Acetobacteraceae bacterium]
MLLNMGVSLRLLDEHAACSNGLQTCNAPSARVALRRRSAANRCVIAAWWGNQFPQVGKTVVQCTPAVCKARFPRRGSAPSGDVRPDAQFGFFQPARRTVSANKWSLEMRKTMFLVAAAMLSLGSASAFAAGSASVNQQVPNQVAAYQAPQAQFATTNQATAPESQDGTTVILQSNPSAPLQTLGG